jgi:endonuclease YncB( thermonuclease family)
MVWWRRKNEGFVWQEYVRTTVLVRREERRKKLEDMREAAVAGVKEAGRQGAVLGAAGARQAARGTATGARYAWAWSRAAGAATADWVSIRAVATWLWLVDRLGPPVGWALDRLREPLPSLVLALVAVFATLSAGATYAAAGLGGEMALAAGVAVGAGVLLVLAQLPAIGVRLGRAGITLPTSAGPALTRAASLAATLAVAIGLVAWLGPALVSGTEPATPVAPGAGLVASAGTVQGRANVLAGDRMRIGATAVRLYGVEAPEVGQTCASSRPCAEAARAALQRVVQGKTVACTVSGRGEDGTSTGTCTVDGADLAAKMVRAGHLFAETGLFSTYAGAEREAREASLGVWRAGVDRPADHRSKLWEAAKGDAPGGCPVKGLVQGNSKTYLVPWERGYERAKVRTSRGERWFCTEAEARAAGWRPPVSPAGG